MLSKLVAEREKSARALMAALDTHKPTLVLELEELLKRGNPDATDLADVGRLMEQLNRSLNAACQAMVEADADHNRELKDDVLLRDRRDEATAVVLQMVKNIRFALTVRYGQSISKRLTSSRSLPTTSNQVLSWGKKFYDTLSKLSLPARSLNTGGDEMGEFSIEIALQKLGQRLLDLELSLNDLAREARQAEKTLAAKDRAIQELNRAQTFASRFLESALRYAGQHELAAKLRPPTRRSSHANADKTNSGSNQASTSE